MNFIINDLTYSAMRNWMVTTTKLDQSGQIYWKGGKNFIGSNNEFRIVAFTNYFFTKLLINLIVLTFFFCSNNLISCETCEILNPLWIYLSWSCPADPTRNSQFLILFWPIRLLVTYKTTTDTHASFWLCKELVKRSEFVFASGKRLIYLFYYS